MVGNSKRVMPNDSSLKMPPLIEGKLDQRYDSVNGSTVESDLFMIYTNKKAYPEYLVTYS